MSRVIVVVCVVLGLAATAFAESKHEQARAHYKSGAAYYQRGKYLDAIREFEQSYELSHKADILYNLAQCHDKLGQRDKVVGYLRRYLKEKPKAEDREQVEAWLANLEKALAAERDAGAKAAADKAAAEARAAAERAAADKAAADKAAAEARAATERAAADKAATDKADAERRAAEARRAAERAAAERAAAGPAVRPVDDAAVRRARREAAEAGSTWRILGDVGIGVGIVAMIGSSVPAVMAYSKARNLEDKLKVTDPANPPEFTTGLQGDYRDGPKLQNIFIGVVSAGAVLVIAGAVAMWYGKKLRRNAEAKLVLVPGAGGTGLAWRF